MMNERKRVIYSYYRYIVQDAQEEKQLIDEEKERNEEQANREELRQKQDETLRSRGI